jgi:nucleoside-diphosphate-sugar epimerase
MAVLITGGSGFVGVNLVEALLERGDAVVVLDAGDLPRGAAHPASIAEVNLRGTINVLEAARKHRIARVLYVGSGAAYGESLYRLPRLYENTPSVPTTLYSITKYAAERMCMRLQELWNLDVACVRLGTVIGPWERDTGVRDNFGTHTQLAAMAVAGKAAVLPSREVQRDWIYSRDVGQALATLLHAPSLSHAVYNVSSGVLWERPIERWCVALRCAFPQFEYHTATTDEQANIWYTDRDRGIMDVGRLAQDAGYKPQYPMDAAYAAYIEWMMKTPEFWSTESRSQR